MTKGAETPDPIAATPLIEGAIANGVFTELERISPQAPTPDNGTPDDPIEPADSAPQQDAPDWADAAEVDYWRPAIEAEDASMHASVDPDDEPPRNIEDHDLPDGSDFADEEA